MHHLSSVDKRNVQQQQQRRRQMLKNSPNCLIYFNFMLRLATFVQLSNQYTKVSNWPTFWMKRHMPGMAADRFDSSEKIVCGVRMKIFVLPYLMSLLKPNSSISVRTPSRSAPRLKFGHVFLDIILYLWSKKGYLAVKETISFICILWICPK